MRGQPPPAKGKNRLYTVTRKPAGGHTRGPEAAVPANLKRGKREGLNASRAGSHLGRDSRRWSRKAPMAVGYPNPLQPRRENPLAHPAPQYPFQQVVAVILKRAAPPISPSLTGSRDGSKWSTCQATPRHAPHGVPTMVQALGIPEELSFRWGKEPHSPGKPGLPPPGCAAEGLSDIPPV
ncbi:hypothetical protein GWK47_029681 [Chionoecetes opilio]|uniref:Uncharacterized protein n=1 Tax=Chionoecetes opilio TaxID=41210 RepID=A0A8J4YKH8_CHIOP|nr:hypothetical protein GWK47_029681 [Chionoecetes opilio]